MCFARFAGWFVLESVPRERPRPAKRRHCIAGTVALAVVLGSTPACAWSQDSVYRCIDGEGRTTLQGVPCADAGSVDGAHVPLRSPASSSLRAGRPASNKPVPEPSKPADGEPDARKWGTEADVMVVSGYEFSAPVTQVQVDHPARPVLLVLTSYHRGTWNVLPAPGTRIKAVVVAAREPGTEVSVQAAQHVPVVTDQLPYAYESSNINFRKLLRTLNTRYGVERVLALRGRYRLPAIVQASGPFRSDPELTVAGIRPEAPAVRFSFDLIGIDGRRLPWTNTGPKNGERYAGIVRGGSSGSHGGGAAVVREGGREAYALKGNGGKLFWSPEGPEGASQEVPVPPGLPRLSWGSGMAWNTRKEVLAIVSFGGEGYFYRYDTRNHVWLDARSLQNRDLYSLAFNAATGGYVALSDRAELVSFTGRGELDEVRPLAELLADLGSTYDRGNARLTDLQVAAHGNAVAIVNVRDGTVTHIWTYDQKKGKAQLTYKPVE